MGSLIDRRIELWVEPRGGGPAINPVMRRLLDEVRAAGAAVAIRVPEDELIEPDRLPREGSPDLVLLKTATSLGLSLAIADERHGVRFLNEARATWRAHDKAATVARLAAAGLSVPTTFLTGGTSAAPTGPADLGGSWVRKPVYGVHGRNVTVHDGFLAAIESAADAVVDGSFVVDDGTRLIQRRIGEDEADLKVYVADGRCFAGRKRFGPASYAADEIEPCALDRRAEEAVRAAGKALELRCFGVDLRLAGRDSVIVDVNPFPGYRGFPEAVVALRAEIERRLEAAGS